MRFFFIQHAHFKKDKLKVARHPSLFYVSSVLTRKTYTRAIDLNSFLNKSFWEVLMRTVQRELIRFSNLRMICLFKKWSAFMCCTVKTPRLIFSQVESRKMLMRAHTHTHKREQVSWKPTCSDFCRSPCMSLVVVLHQEHLHISIQLISCENAK